MYFIYVYKYIFLSDMQDVTHDTWQRTRDVSHGTHREWWTLSHNCRYLAPLRIFFDKPLFLSWNFERRCTCPHLSRVRCQMSGVTCQVSHVTCHISFLFYFPDKLVKLVVGGSVINGKTLHWINFQSPVSFLQYMVLLHVAFCYKEGSVWADTKQWK